ncbi:MAG: diguanylate cyclase/phosphodiesterase [Hyphomicrobiales bacterium]|nr:diguanylate cyclase/phosphodiesterase [Hyphomicrobiales bacterium]
METKALTLAAEQLQAPIEQLQRHWAEQKDHLLCAALDVLPEGIVLLDSEGRYVHWNKSYAQIYKATADLFAVGARFADTLRVGLERGDYPEAIGREDAWFEERMRRLNGPGTRHEQQLADGRWILIDERRLEDNSLIGLRIDITELKQRQDSFRLLFEGNPVPMFVIEVENARILAVNDAALEHYGYTREALVGRNKHELVCGNAFNLHDSELTSKGAERHLRADGSVIDVAVFARRLTYAERPSMLVAAIDVTERNRSEARIAHMARHDALTGLSNRTMMRETLDELCASGKPFSVFLIDLDHFKTINDTLGHSAGDELLKQISQRLLMGFPAPSNVVRLGGDEFAIIYCGDQSAASLREAASWILDAAAMPVMLSDCPVHIGASVGICAAARDTKDTETVLRRADIALYQAKAAGRNAFRLFDPAMDAALQAKLKFESDLREAIVTRQLEVHYQPIMGLDTGAPKSMEALVRWRHPERGVVNPSDFIPVAEATGMIRDIGLFVLKTACMEAASWPKSVAVAVNVSPAQLRDVGFYETVMDAISAAGLEPSRLELEITESLLMEATESTLACLTRLRDAGIGVSMDDFGTGYSSLSYLRKFPFTKIKIDKSFVLDMEHNADARAIVRAIVGLGRSLGMDVVAEGVERASDLSLLQDEGCPAAQGFLFSTPMSSTQTRDFLCMPLA